MRAKKILWGLFVFHAVGVGLYPFVFYFLLHINSGLLSSKPLEILQSLFWKSAFYLHISFGGIALLTGWSQFSKRMRTKKIRLHRTLGKIYVLSVLISGCSGVYVAIYSNGGMVTHFGFGILAILWLFTTVEAYATIKKRAIINHRNWMIRSYALCFAAVMLRLWLGVSIAAHMDFNKAYIIISWLCWVPNLIVAEMIIRRQPKVYADEPELMKPDEALVKTI